MTQFVVYANPRDSHGYAPYLVDVQSDLLDVETRAVIPLAEADYLHNRISRLNPVFEIASRHYVLATTEIVAVVKSDLQTTVADISEHRGEIVDALDLLFTGI